MFRIHYHGDFAYYTDDPNNKYYKQCTGKLLTNAI